MPDAMGILREIEGFLNPSADDCKLGNLTLKQIEIRHIRAALDACGWNVSRAAKQLDIDRITSRAE